MKHRLPNNLSLFFIVLFSLTLMTVRLFSSKSHIESLLTEQKKGIRAVTSGYVNNRYKIWAVLPAHAKETFKEHGILTVHSNSTVALQTILTMHKVSHFPIFFLPLICGLIPNNIPGFGNTYNDCVEWSNIYNTHTYKTSIFFKGPLLAISENNTGITTPSTLSSLSSYKIHA